MSGRPPPEPPTTVATCLTRSPALKAPTSDFETVTTSCTLAPSTETTRTAASPSLSRDCSAISRSIAASKPSTRSAIALPACPPLSGRAAASRSSAPVPPPPPPWASFRFRSPTSFSSWRSRSRSRSSFSGRSAVPDRNVFAAVRSVPSMSRTYASEFSPVAASMRRTPAATPPSLMILKSPMSPSACACVPPQSSTESGVIVRTRTTSPYFSSKMAIAPARLRLIDGQDLREHGGVREHLRVHEVLDARELLRRQPLAVREVEAEPVGPHERSLLRRLLSEHDAKGPVQQVRRRMIPSRRAPGAPRRPRAIRRRPRRASLHGPCHDAR